MRELQRCLAAPVRVALSGHCLNVAVPLEVEGLAAEVYRAPHLLLRRLVPGMLAKHGDLRRTMTGVLLGVQLIRRRGLAWKSVVPGQLLEHARCRAVAAPMHRLDEGEE